ncbi:MAG: DMT family transporter [Firmicutes bacterium]|nr:DMT family transporter [Bacillota bacterium]
MLAGYLYLLVAVFAWSSYPVLAKIAYGLGMTPLTLGFLRFGFALPVLLLACAGLHRVRPCSLRWDRPLWRRVLAQGVASAGAALTSLYAVELMPASLATILLYLSPTFTCLLAAAFFREKITRGRLAALVVTLAGLAAVVGPAGPVAAPPGAVVLAVASAFLSAVYFLLGQQNSGRVHPLVLAAVMGVVSVILFAAVRLALPGTEVPVAAVRGTVLLLAVAIALLPTTLGPVMDLLGIRVVGAARAAIFITLEPPLALLLARLLLGERLLPVQVLGAALVLAGVLILGLEDYYRLRLRS